MDNLAERLKRARKERGITQAALAQRIGVSTGVIANIEYDRASSIQEIVINGICNELNINKDWLLNGVGEMDSGDSKRLLNEIAELAANLSPAEQDYILDMIKTFNQHREKIHVKEPPKGLDAVLQDIEQRKEPSR